ncbi:GNAT family N-acetyltransferase [Nocardioides aurantiacus]|uniref:RimJ/RimL family protein N-acetyltransferase n=1 Tax=Nocardioides aurantiacus TaxID=86796 RepID=A0A3N2CTN5_9ACTN|nr:GNAT family N-acetyltransferase [Nocardioides aurantiacus]ROR90900.1 RimJ/RimL family protein N-acetyltransferase [Nocardioides aurantiacus]
MADLDGVPWPPAPIRTPRLLLRRPAASDRDGVIELLCSEAATRYLGGPQSRADLSLTLPQGPTGRPGVFTIEANRQFVGTVSFDRRDASRPGHVRASGLEIEVSYAVLPDELGNGYGAEALAGALGWVAQVMPREPVVLCTQTANRASMRVAEQAGFLEVARFEEFDAEQWFGVRQPEGATA